MEQLTPDGIAGVAVVRVAAAERSHVLASLRLRSGAPIVVRAGVPQRATLWCDGIAVDDVLVVDRGASGLELHLHGSPAVLAALRRHDRLHFAAPGGPVAALLRDALGDAQLDLALEQSAFDFAAELARLAAQPAPRRRSEREAALARSRVAMALVVAPRVVLVGQQNAGKSTLFNRLLGRDRVVTGATPGLTRDLVAERTVLAGYPYELVDTAGEGELIAAVDVAAVARAQQALHGAIGVLVVDGSRGPVAADRERAAACALVVATKADLPRAAWPAGMRCDLAVAAGPGRMPVVRAEIGEALRCLRGLPPAGAVGGFAALDAAQWQALQAVPA